MNEPLAGKPPRTGPVHGMRFRSMLPRRRDAKCCNEHLLFCLILKRFCAGYLGWVLICGRGDDLPTAHADFVCGNKRVPVEKRHSEVGWPKLDKKRSLGGPTVGAVHTATADDLFARRCLYPGSHLSPPARLTLQSTHEEDCFQRDRCPRSSSEAFAAVINSQCRPDLGVSALCTRQAIRCLFKVTPARGLDQVSPLRFMEPGRESSSHDACYRQPEDQHELCAPYQPFVR
jgi:hypothetical protein